MSSTIQAAPIARRALTSQPASVCRGGPRNSACVVLILPMSLLPRLIRLATLSAWTGRRLNPRAGDVNRRARQMVSNKQRPSAVKVTVELRCSCTVVELYGPFLKFADHAGIETSVPRRASVNCPDATCHHRVRASSARGRRTARCRWMLLWMPGGSSALQRESMADHRPSTSKARQR